MLAEGFTTRRGRRGAFLHLDAIYGRVRARKGARLTALTNGGAIPDMFDYNVVLDPENIVVGSLNEDFALESLPGDIFALGNHCWQLLRVEGLNVRVRDAQGLPPTVPFWFGEGPGRSKELSEAVSRLRAEISERVHHAASENGAGELVPAIRWLTDTVGLQASAAEQLVWYLAAGERALGAMPTRKCVVMERFFDEVGDMHLVVHSPFGSRVNKGWGLALRKRFCTRFNFELQAAANEDSIVISLGPVHSFELAEVFRYLSTATLRDTLVQALLDTPMFEVRWRWNASRALAVARNRNGSRVPPQLQRMQAEDLVSQVFPDQIACAENIAGPREIPDHPLVRQTLHDCLTEALDIDELLQLIGRIEREELVLIAKDLREPSPFAQEIINARPYAFLDDAPFEERRTNAVRNRRWLDPGEAAEYGALDAEAIAKVREEAWPQMENADEVHDGLLLLGFMRQEEMPPGDGPHSFAALFAELVRSGRATRFVCGGRTLLAATERLPQLAALYPDHRLEPEVTLPDWLKEETHSQETAAREILRGRLEGLGPVTLERLIADTGLDVKHIEAALLALETEGFVFRGRYSPGLVQEEWCERRLLQRIHRYTIESHRQSVQPVSLQDFMRFVFAHHKLGAAFPQTGPESLQRALEKLEGIAAPAAAWESDILPARIDRYDPNWLDVLCISGRVIWGRFKAAKPSANGGHRQSAVKSTPISILSRSNAPLWAAFSQSPEEPVPLGSDARLIEEDLKQHGASFLDDMLKRTRLLKTQAETALGELVANGRVNNDSYTGLRSLLTPARKKPGGHGRRRGHRAAFGIEHAGRWSLIAQGGDALPPDDEALTELVSVYLKRWGVLFRKLLERETFAPPWRVLVRLLRKMELRGELRGGRFVAGVGGEQFAFPETVDRLRQIAKQEKTRERIVLSAADPLNLLGVILPGDKAARIAHNRVLYEDGVPIAVWEAREVRFLKPLDGEKQAAARQALLGRKFPSRLQAYLGKGAAQAR